MTITTHYDLQAGELVISTPHGMILVNECQKPNITRVTILEGKGGIITRAKVGQVESPIMLVIWGPVGVEEPPFDEQDTKPDMPTVYDDLEVGD